MGFLKCIITIYEKSWKSESPSCSVSLSLMPFCPVPVQQKDACVVFSCSFGVYMFSLKALSSHNQNSQSICHYAEPLEAMSVHCRVNVGINCLRARSVFTVQPLTKTNRCTELLSGCLTPDPWKWWGGWGRRTINLQRKFERWRRWWRHYLGVGRLHVLYVWAVERRTAGSTRDQRVNWLLSLHVVEIKDLQVWRSQSAPSPHWLLLDPLCKVTADETLGFLYVLPL